MTPKQALDCVEARIPEASLLNVKAARAILRAFIEANTPWLPPQQEGFGPWIEYGPGDPGPHINDTVVVLLQGRREAKVVPKPTKACLARTLHWGESFNPIVAYCVKLPEAE